MKIKIVGTTFIVTAAIFLVGFIYTTFLPLFFDHREYLIFEFDVNRAALLLAACFYFLTLSVGIFKLKRWAWKAGILTAILLGIFNLGALVYILAVFENLVAALTRLFAFLVNLFIIYVLVKKRGGFQAEED